MNVRSFMLQPGRWAIPVAVLFAVCVLPLRPALAQFVSGRVTDTDGQSVPGANILVEGTVNGTAAALDGSFLLGPLPVGIVSLKASAIGFVPTRTSVRVPATDTVQVAFVLEEQVLESDEVVIVASRREQAAFRVPVSVATVSSSDLRARNVQRLDEALKSVSGVHVQGNQVTIRGSSGFAYNTGSRVLTMVDGMPLLSPDTDGIPLDALPTSEIERIEVLKGPGSALYGGGALGGVINVVTRPIPNEPETRVNMYSGVWEPVGESVWKRSWSGASAPRPFFGASVSHARRHSPAFGWWVSGTFRRDLGYLRNSAQTSLHTYAKTTWRPSSDKRLDVLAGVMVRERDNFLFWASGRDVLSPGSLSLDSAAGDPPGGSTDDFVNQFTLLPAWTHFLSPDLYYEVRGRMYGALVRPINNETGKYEPLSKGSIGFRYGGEAQVHSSPDDATQITAGLSVDAISLRNSFLVTPDGDQAGSQPEGAMFVHAERTLGPRLEVVAGLRHDVYRIGVGELQQQTSPKVAAAYSLGPAASLRVAWGAGFRVPSFAERYTDNRDFFPIVRNLALKPERSRSLETGARFRVRVPSGRARADIAVFRTTYDDLVEPRLIPALQAFQFVNIAKAEVSGAEATLEWATSDQRTSIEAGYTFLETNDTETSTELPFRASHLLTTSGQWHVARGWSVGADYRYVSRPGRVDTDFARFVTDADLMTATHLVDIRIGYERGPWRVGVNTDNALAYRYVERPAYFGVPRHYTLRIEWKGPANN